LFSFLAYTHSRLMTGKMTRADRINHSEQHGAVPHRTVQYSTAQHSSGQYSPLHIVQHAV
jgi:hypothetical protein